MSIIMTDLDDELNMEKRSVAFYYCFKNKQIRGIYYTVQYTQAHACIMDISK